jgi:hypothetical protein
MVACIKYITKSQTLKVKTDAGVEKEYRVSDVEISTKGNKSVAGLAEGLASLAIGPNDFEIYEMDWRTKIQLQEASEGSKAGAGTTAPTKKVCPVLFKG